MRPGGRSRSGAARAGRAAGARAGSRTRSPRGRRVPMASRQGTVPMRRATPPAGCPRPRQSVCLRCRPGMPTAPHLPRQPSEERRRPPDLRFPGQAAAATCATRDVVARLPPPAALGHARHGRHAHGQARLQGPHPGHEERRVLTPSPRGQRPLGAGEGQRATPVYGSSATGGPTCGGRGREGVEAAGRCSRSHSPTWPLRRDPWQTSPHGRFRPCGPDAPTG